jgi:hypothetical protein
MRTVGSIPSTPESGCNRFYELVAAIALSIIPSESRRYARTSDFVFAGLSTRTNKKYFQHAW